MRRRIIQHNSSFYITQFTTLSVSALQQALPQNVDLPRRHTKFISELLSLHYSKPKDLDRILEQHPHIPNLSLPNLIRRVSTIKESLTELSNASDPASANPTPQLFDKSMCADYHHLFVAALHGYRNHLKLLSSLSRKNPHWRFKNEDDKKNVIDAFQMVWAASRILRVYAFSPTFPIYLLAVRHVNIYSFQPPNLSHEPSIDQSEDDEEEEGEEAKELEERGNNLGDARIKIKRWLHLQVAPWAALDILSAYAVDETSPKASVSLLAAQPHEPPRGIVWKDVVTKIVGPENSSTVITNIKTRIQSLVAEYEKLPPRVRSIVHPFKNSAGDSDTIQFKGTLHCEAVLASLVKYPELAGAEKDQDLLNLILVSKYHKHSNIITLQLIV